MSFNLKSIAFVLALAATFIGGVKETQASDSCTNVKISFTNKRTTTIKVLKIEFYNSDSGKWHTEDVKDTECAKGATCTTSGDNLADAEGRNITKIKLTYKYKEADGDWSDDFHGGEKAIASGSQRCTANKTYGPFEITG